MLCDAAIGTGVSVDCYKCLGSVSEADTQVPRRCDAVGVERYTTGGRERLFERHGDDPRRFLSQTLSMSKGISGIRITSADPAIPELSAMKPALRPITSTTITRSWLSAVECSLSIASVAVETAVSKPNVATVPPTSLSIV